MESSARHDDGHAHPAVFTMDLTERLRIVAALDDADSPSDVIDRIGLAAFASGHQPWSRSLRVHRVRTDARLVPPGVAPVRTWLGPDSTTLLAEGSDWTLSVHRWSDRSADLVVTATTAEVGQRILDESVAGAAEPARPDDGGVTMGFWHSGEHGVRRTERTIQTAPWAQIRANYASSVTTSLERLLTLDPGRLSGRLVLLHGPPGTGKTTLLRTLAHAWRSWCRVDYILDPERMLSRPEYLMRVALAEVDDDHVDADDDTTPARRRWRLLVLEDCDELIRSEAKQGTGQSLARLLNLTDGLLGQGLEVLVCITTNEDLTRLHPAVVRPGRCLAQIHVGRLPLAEASAWLGTSSGIGSQGATLAELFARRGALDRIDADRPDEPIGLYL